jgi:hypothetical protein
MNLTMQVKLLTNEAEATSLLATMERFNAACDAIAEVAHAQVAACMGLSRVKLISRRLPPSPSSMSSCW